MTPSRSASSVPGQCRCVCSRLSSESAREVVVGHESTFCLAIADRILSAMAFYPRMHGERHHHQRTGLTKHFTVKKKTVEAVTDLDLEVERGELVAFLGPNGAGKSTSLRMLTTLLPPTAGTATVVGYDIRTRPGRRARAASATSASSRAAATTSACATSCSARARSTAWPRADAARRADELHRVARPRPARRPRGAESERRAEAAARRRARPDARPAAAVPRRAVDRARPAEPREPLAAHPRPARASTARRCSSRPTTSRRPTATPSGCMVMDNGRVIADDTRRGAQGDARRRRAHARLRRSAMPRRGRGRRAADRARRAAACRRVTARASITATSCCRVCCAHWTPPASGDPRRPACQPTLDDVFLALTGRSLRDGEGGPRPSTDHHRVRSDDEKVPA